MLDSLSNKFGLYIAISSAMFLKFFSSKSDNFLINFFSIFLYSFFPSSFIKSETSFNNNFFLRLIKSSFKIIPTFKQYNSSLFIFLQISLIFSVSILFGFKIIKLFFNELCDIEIFFNL